MARSSCVSTLNGVFKEVYEKKLFNLVPDSLVLNGRAYAIPHFKSDSDYTVLVHPDTYKKLTEDSMATYPEECKAVEETPMQRALESHKYQIRNLRESIARKQMELKIELARYAAVKKLAAKGVK